MTHESKAEAQSKLNFVFVFWLWHRGVGGGTLLRIIDEPLILSVLVLVLIHFPFDNHLGKALVLDLSFELYFLFTFLDRSIMVGNIAVLGLN